MKLKIYEEQSVQKKLEVDVEKVKAELLDVQRAERMVRVDMEQASKKVNMLRHIYVLIILEPWLIQNKAHKNNCESFLRFKKEKKAILTK